MASSSITGWKYLADAASLQRLVLLRETYPDLSGIPIEALAVDRTPPFTLRLAHDQLTLFTEAESSWSGISVDFMAGSMAHRLRQPVRGELVVKAVWGRSKDPMTVLDATAGLGRDGFLLASSGADVISCERHPAVALLLADGHWRATQSGQLGEALQHWTFRYADALALMAEVQPDVIYLDPMFPEREKSALVKKEMRAFRDLVGEDQDAQALFDAACRFARKRVVVKRPASGDFLGRKPSHVIAGKANRFDVYAMDA